MLGYPKKICRSLKLQLEKPKEKVIPNFAEETVKVIPAKKKKGPIGPKDPRLWLINGKKPKDNKLETYIRFIRKEAKEYADAFKEEAEVNILADFLRAYAVGKDDYAVDENFKMRMHLQAENVSQFIYAHFNSTTEMEDLICNEEVTIIGFREIGDTGYLRVYIFGIPPYKFPVFDEEASTDLEIVRRKCTDIEYAKAFYHMDFDYREPLRKLYVGLAVPASDGITYFGLAKGPTNFVMGIHFSLEDQRKPKSYFQEIKKATGAPCDLTNNIHLRMALSPFSADDITGEPRIRNDYPRFYNLAQFTAIRDDFPLRGFITCGCCGNTMTSCLSKGRNSHYPYYLCYSKGCEQYGKSIRKEDMERDFEDILIQLRPSQELFSMAKSMFEELWEYRRKNSQNEVLSTQKELQDIDRKVGQLLDRVVDADSQTLISAYEGRIKELEIHKVALTEKIKNCGRPLQSFDETFRTAFEFLGNPHKIWVSGGIEDKRTVLKLAFAEKLAYRRNEGFRTAATALPFRVLSDFQRGNKGMVEATGVEPATP